MWLLTVFAEAEPFQPVPLLPGEEPEGVRGTFRPTKAHAALCPCRVRSSHLLVLIVIRALLFQLDVHELSFQLGAIEPLFLSFTFYNITTNQRLCETFQVSATSIHPLTL